MVHCCLTWTWGKLSRYLNPSKAKLQSKGVDSVRSRVVNLKELNPDITLSTLKEALVRSFAAVYGAEPVPLTDGDLGMEEISRLAQRNRSWEWNFGAKVPFTCEFEERFSWGGVQIQLNVENGVITRAKVYSDAMDWSFVTALEQTITGCRCDAAELEARLRGWDSELAEDIRGLLYQNLL